MNENSPLVTKALAHMRMLAQTIGPRLAGSEGEKRGQAYISEQLRSWGYTVAQQPVAFAPSPRFDGLYPAAGTLLLLAGPLLRSFPWLALVMPFLLAALPQVARWQIRRRVCLERSQNLYAIAPTSGAAVPDLILCAHVDSARAGAFQGHFGRQSYGHALDFVQRMAILLAALAALQLLGFNIPGAFYPIAAIIGSILAGWWIFMEVYNQVAAGDRRSPGAIDNASGVSVLLALAEHFAIQDSPPICLGFLFSGAEETGLHGAETFAASLAQQGTPVRVICLDMVGAGNTLRYVSKDGTIKLLRTDAALNHLIRTACPAVVPLWQTQKSGDSAAFLCHHIPAAELQVSGSQAAALVYHTTDDDMSFVEPAALAITLQTLLQVIALLDNGVSTISEPQF